MRSKKFNYWLYVCIAIGILILGAFAPYLFAKLSWGIVEFGEKTGSIGDTIGGITAPFLSLAGSILVFAALRAQINANDIVIEQFETKEQQRIEDLKKRDQERLEERAKEEQERTADVRNKMEMLLLDLDSMLKDIESKGAKMKEYGEHELRAPFEFKVLNRTASNSYDRVHNLDREAIYKGFKLFLSSDPDWVKKYRTLYNYLDFIKAFFPDIYRKYDDLVKELVQLKSNTARQIDSMMTFAANSLKQLEGSMNPGQFHKEPYYILVNNFIINWYKFLESDQRTVGVKLGEAKVNHFSLFIEAAIKFTKEVEKDPSVMKLIELVRAVIMDIVLIEFKSKEFGQNILDAYAQILVDTDDGKCLHSGLKELKEFIENGINTDDV